MYRMKLQDYKAVTPFPPPYWWRICKTSRNRSRREANVCAGFLATRTCPSLTLFYYAKGQDFPNLGNFSPVPCLFGPGGWAWPCRGCCTRAAPTLPTFAPVFFSLTLFFGIIFFLQTVCPAGKPLIPNFCSLHNECTQSCVHFHVWKVT